MSTTTSAPPRPHRLAHQWRTAVWLGLLLAVPSLARAADAPTRFEFRLYEALWQKGDVPVKGGPSLILMVSRTGADWGRVVGVAGEMNVAVHLGHVASGSATDQAIDLTIPITIYGDAYVPGGPAEYKISLKNNEAGLFEGTYAGKFRGIAVQGKADGRVLPAQKVRAGVEPIKPGEHPRLLFRKSDLPALKEKAKTPFGQALLAKMDDDIGLGIKYQLTGDKQYADQARAIVEKILQGDYSSARTPGSHHGILHYGWVWEHPAVAYDLCYDAWDEAFRKRVERYIILWSQRIIYQRAMFNTQGQYGHGNPEAGSLYYGNALGTLAIWGEKGPEPVKPPAPDTVTEIAPAADYKPGRDVPVVPLEPGKSPAKWLASKVVPAIVEGDPLAELGGVEKCRPEAGTSFTFENTKYDFQPLAPEFVPDGGGVIVNIGKSIRPSHVKSRPGPELARDGPITLCIYTVLDNPKAQAVTVVAAKTRFGGEQFILNGHSLLGGQVVKLEKGLYPLTVVIRIKARWDWQQPMLAEASEADVAASKALIEQQHKEHAEAVKDWEFRHAAWERSGGADQEYQELFDTWSWLMYMQYREGVGTGGAIPDVSGEAAVQGLFTALYASAFRTAFGYDASPYGDIDHVVPRKIFAHVYPQQGEPQTQDLPGPNNLGPDFFAFSFPIMPDEWKPAVLWAWNRQCGITGDGDWGKLAAGHANTPARAFVNYPLDMKAQPPKDIMPLTWDAPDFGYYGFRSGWEGKDDFLFQVWLQSNGPKGYSLPNAGTFRLMGLGHEWVVGFPSVRLDNHRYFDPVVMLPEDGINENGRGRAIFTRVEKDGSGALTADLNDVYCEDVKYGKYGNIRRADTFKASGITGLRAYAVDYSGKSGAPCLLVLVDKIEGGKSKVWPWYLAGVKADPKTGKILDVGDIKRTKAEGNTVTVTKDDGATMKMTFIGPADPVVKAETRTLKFQQTYNRGESSFTAPGIYATGADPKDGEFFVIITIQKGPAPEVKVEGKGLAAEVTVGKQSIRYVDQKIVIGLP